jgi:hypothetical protein
MAQASLVGLACLALSFTGTIVAIVRARRLHRRVPAVIAVVLLLFHPTVWLGVTSGDCGGTLLVVGPVFAVLHGGIAGLLMLAKPPAP